MTILARASVCIYRSFLFCRWFLNDSPSSLRLHGYNFQRQRSPYAFKHAEVSYWPYFARISINPSFKVWIRVTCQRYKWIYDAGAQIWRISYLFKQFLNAYFSKFLSVANEMRLGASYLQHRLKFSSASLSCPQDKWHRILDPPKDFGTMYKLLSLWRLMALK